MALDLDIVTIAGHLCTVSLLPSETVLDLKAAIEAETKIPWSEQKLLLQANWEHTVLKNSQALSDCGLDAHDQDIMLVRSRPYNGKYKVDIKWNGSPTVEILGDLAKVSWGEHCIEAEIQWDPGLPQKATFTGLKLATSEWARRHTRGGHKDSDGVTETFTMMFKGDAAADGFSGTFQRQFEGPLPMQGCYLGDD
eukprot:TRINITY_DN34856_c0_g1_i1.p1 TRINITY_DN34856_c0_g1~~TRINITY_DN34856_c0_g1_i1.p1  ORF type:complete len:229 (+),score=35.56 TRINITY_DN34856_c0_g1_i1:104-688(+)